MISCFSSFDGTSLRQCREYNSDYAWVTFYANIAGAIGPFVASLTIKDAPEGSGGNFDKVLHEVLGYLGISFSRIGIFKVASQKRNTFFKVFRYPAK